MDFRLGKFELWRLTGRDIKARPGWKNIRNAKG